MTSSNQQNYYWNVHFTWLKLSGCSTRPLFFFERVYPLWNMLRQAVIIQTQGGAKYSKLRKTHSAVVKVVQTPCYVLESTGSVHHASGVRWQRAVGLCKLTLWPQYVTLYMLSHISYCCTFKHSRMECAIAPISKIDHIPLTHHVHFDSIYILAVWF